MNDSFKSILSILSLLQLLFGDEDSTKRENKESLTSKKSSRRSLRGVRRRRNEELSKLLATLFNPAFFLYLGNSFIDHFVVITGAHFYFRFFRPGDHSKDKTGGGN